jgi:hypothetical protein
MYYIYTLDSLKYIYIFNYSILFMFIHILDSLEMLNIYIFFPIIRLYLSMIYTFPGVYSPCYQHYSVY